MADTFETFVATSASPASRVAELRNIQQLLTRAAAVIAFSALWGVAAGSARPLLALANAYKVPMVVCLTVLVTMPAVLVTRTLLRAPAQPLELLAVLVNGLYRGTLVLLGFAPLLAVYSYTSQWFAPVLGQVSAGVALVIAAFAFIAELRKLEISPSAALPLALVSIIVMALALLQLVVLATPILTVPTVFGHGIDGMVQR